MKQVSSNFSQGNFGNSEVMRGSGADGEIGDIWNSYISNLTITEAWPPYSLLSPIDLHFVTPSSMATE